MKSLFNIALKAAIAMAAFAGLQLAASAQTKEITETYPEFSAINIANDFNVTVDRGDEYIVSLTVDEALAPYITVRLQGKTLYVSYEEKSVPKEVKKLYSGRNAPKPVFNALISMPKVESITIANNVKLNNTVPFDGIDKFELSATEKAEVVRFNVSARSANISLQKNASAVMSINTENDLNVSASENAKFRLASQVAELNINAKGSANVAVTNISAKLNIQMKGSPEVSVSGPCEDAIVNAEGSGKLTLSGGGASLSVKATKASIDAYNLEVTTADVELSGNATLSVNASDLIELNLNGGKVQFGGSPIFKITKISKASVTPYGASE